MEILEHSGMTPQERLDAPEFIAASTEVNLSGMLVSMPPIMETKETCDEQFKSGCEGVLLWLNEKERFVCPICYRHCLRVSHVYTMDWVELSK